MVSDGAKCLLITVLVFFSLWNGSKVLFYWDTTPMTSVDYNATACEVGVPEGQLWKHKECAGIPTQYNLFRGMGWEAPHKLRADKDGFLIPHTMIGVSLEVLMIFALLFGRVNLYYRSKVMLPVAFLFALHILPVASGIPDSLSGAPLNEVLAGLIMLSCCVGWYGMYKEFKENNNEPPMDKPSGKLLTSVWIAIGILVNIAPIGEWAMILSSANADHAFPDVPSPESGKDFYARLNVPWIGRIAGAFCAFTTFMYVFDNYAIWRGESWRSVFNKDGPALFQLMLNPYPKTDELFRQRPERWLEATGECFILCIGISWVITSIFNPVIYKENILRSIVGYNNLCVGFDSPPARYFAMPLLVCQAVLASRYTYLDTVRLKATQAELSGKQFCFGYFVNTFFALWMMCFPMLLVITAEFDSWSSTKIHLYLFMGTLFVMWLMIAGNVYEADEKDVDLGCKIWFGMFTAHTLLLPVVGIIDVLAFHPELPADQIYTIRYERPHPPVPWPITAYLDYGWFMLLLLTVIFLPDAPPVQTTFHVEMAEKIGAFEGEDGRPYPYQKVEQVREAECLSDSEEEEDSDGDGSMCA